MEAYCGVNGRATPGFDGYNNGSQSLYFVALSRNYLLKKTRLVSSPYGYAYRHICQPLVLISAAGCVVLP